MNTLRPRRVSSLVLWSALLALGALQRSHVVSAQTTNDQFFVHGRNVNTVGLTPPGPNPQLAGNPRHKQRNEASLDVSPNNPLLILGANNDYRGVEQFGDSWIGLFMSRNGGLTWTSRLLEGFPAAPNGVGAADPVVRTMPGLGLVSYITISRNDSRGSLALAVLLERNKENGEPYQYLRTNVIGNGTPGRFNDKPAMLAVLNDAGGTVNVGGRVVPRGIVHFAYSVFPGNENNSSSQIFHLFSNDYGMTWSNATKLSESLGINQGVDLAVHGSTAVAAWRQVADTNQADGIVFVRSANGGATWSKPEVLWSPPAPGRFFDQDTTALQFRTRSMPAIVHDGVAFHAFWSARGFAPHPDDARIVVSSSRDGRQWNGPFVVDGYAGRGHQIKPQAAVAGGRVQVNWVDTRNNAPGSFERFIADYRYDPATGARVPLSAPAGPSDPITYVYRQMADLFSAQSFAAAPTGQAALAFGASSALSQYRRALIDGHVRQADFHFINARMFQNGGVPFNGDYHAVSGQRHRPSDTVPGAWVRNTALSTSHALFYSAFTDNRDVQGWVSAGPPSTAFTPSATLQGESGSETVTACDTSSSQTTLDRTVWSPTDSPRARYQNIYAAPTYPGLLVASPSASKPTGTLERAYVIFVRNLTPQDRTYRFTIANQPADAGAGTGRASFRQNDPAVPFTNCVDGAGCTMLDVAIPRGSSVTRTVYVTSSLARPRIVVRVQETGGTQNGSVILNANPNIAEVENPDGEELENILTAELYQPDILGREATVYVTGLTNPDVTPVQGIEAPRIEYPRIEYPRIEYPRIEYDPLGYPRIEYPRIEYDPLGNPRIEYPRIEYPRIEYTSVENPRIEYSAIGSDDVGVTDVTWPISTDGANTTTAMSAKVFVNGTLTGVTGAQLLVSVPQFATVFRTCDGAPINTVENQVVVNTVIDTASLTPTSGGPDTVNPPSTQPTFAVPPNQVAYLTLRLVGRADAQLARRAGLIVRSQPDTSDGDQTDEDIDTGFVDVTPPVINLGGLSTGLTVEGNRPGGGDVSFVVTATDDGGETTISCVRTGQGSSTPVPADGTSTFFPLGSWQVTCTAVDASGNEASSSFAVSVLDTTPPSLDVSGLQVSLAFTTGGAIITYNTSAVTATDLVDSTPTVVCTPASGTLVPLGSAQLTCTATDDAGNAASATYAFSVVDSTPPVLTVPSSLVVAATSPAGAVVTYSATAIDTVDATPTVTCSPPSGSTFPFGTTTVSCTATDDAGNTSAALTFTVTVRDTTAPAAITATVSPVVLWPPTGATTLVTVSGRALDNESGVATIEWRVVDEYRQHQPAGSIAVPSDGAFSFQVPLIQDRRGNDKDGRHYTIQLTAIDRAGNRLQLLQPLVVTVHDQGGL
jgi:HYR domain